MSRPCWTPSAAAPPTMLSSSVRQFAGRNRSCEGALLASELADCIVKLWDVASSTKALKMDDTILESYVVSGKGTSNDNEQPELKPVGEPGAGPTTVVCLPPSPDQRAIDHASFLKELVPNDTKRKNCSSIELLIQSCYY
ncbi:hypothetical protein TRIUR3_10558 [Triticum urartu]|uniref:Uncharacterized protein n=1 Tax=Triticum urartu TaxID=4572 RepID=M7ZZ59_TRIUA|nr:hypothetical protein TRIUR3_10558 [Triticum urartu]